MGLAALPLPLGSNPARYGQAGAARLINVYVERVGADAKSEYAWWACDGLSSFATLTGGGGIRCMIALSESDALVVAGRNVFRVDGAGGNTLIGGLASDGMVTAAVNRIGQVAFVCDGLYYGYVGGTFSQLADPDLPPPISVTHLDGYFVFFLADGRFFLSGIDDWDIDALDTATAEANPDGGVRNITRGRDVLLLGEKTTEFWANTGDTFPFARTTANDIGCRASDSVVELEQTIFMIAHDATVRVLQGYQWNKVSTHPVERFITEETHPHLISGCAWQARGHSFYCISGDNGSWCYDVATGQWHERQSYGLDRWRVAKTMQFGDKVIAGDYASGLLYEMRPDVYDEAGTELVAQIQLAPTYAMGRRVQHNRLEVGIIAGVGLVDGGSHLTAPKLMLDYSEDGGANWSAQRMISMGAAGQSLQRAVATRLGASRSRTYRIGMSAAVQRGVTGVFLDSDVLGH